MKKTIIISVLLVTVGIFMGVLLVSNIDPSAITSVFAAEKTELGAKNPPIVPDANAVVLNNALVSVSEAVLPTVVSISVDVELKNYHKGRDGQFREFFKFFGDPEDDKGDSDGNDDTYRSRGAGSGVFISSDGYIVTNNHVVEDAVEHGIKVTTVNRETYDAKLIGRDPLTDLALIKIEGDNFPVAHFESINNVKVGEMVLAVGNPLGLSSTVTSGIVSAIGRGNLGLNRRNARSSYAVEHFIQTDAAINPGNSGGGLFNLSGSLVGINSAIATGTGNYIGYGFAIPVNLVKSVILDLMEDGKINRGYIGVRIKSIDQIEAKALDLDHVGGVLIIDVIEGSAGDAAGLDSLDIILEVDGKPIATSSELQSEIAIHRAGDDVKLTIWRDGKKIHKTVTLKAKDDDNETAFIDNKKERKDDEDEGKPYEFEKLGFTAEPLTGKMKKEFDVNTGVYITKVKRYSPASERGMVPNGVIHMAGKQKVKSVGQLMDIIDDKKAGDAILFQVKYPEMNRIIAIEIPS